MSNPWPDSGKRATTIGKGSNRRPSQVSDKTFEENWERTFPKKKPEKEE